MTSFHNVRLPVDVEQGSTGGPGFDTTVLKLSSGFEKRNINWERELGEWDISYGVRTKADLDAVKAFFYARRARAYGFRFKDWSDFQIGAVGSPHTIFTLGGITTVIQVYKTYSDAGGSFARKITRLVSGTLSVYVGGVLKTETTHYTVNYDTGVITLLAVYGTLATGTLTSTANFANTETVTINGKVYTFQSALTNVDGHVKIGASEAASLANLFHAINASGGTPGTDYATATVVNADVSATNPTGHTVVLTSKKEGTLGNAITTTETCANASFGGAVLSGGVDVIVGIISEYDIPVRFDVDKLKIRMMWEDAMEIPSIPIVGLKE